jgi:SAM-dependent MidA family methyltransferase
MWRALGSPEQIEVLEPGPGRGLFAQDVLDWSEKKFPDFFQAMHYTLVEKSLALRKRLQSTFSRKITDGKASIRTLDQGLTPATCEECCGTAEAVPFHGDAASLNRASHKSINSHKAIENRAEVDIRGADAGGRGAASVVHEQEQIVRAMPAGVPIIVFANEFFDALPVEVISPRGALRVNVDTGRFVETWVPASAGELDFLDRYSAHPGAGERVEVGLAAQDCMARIAASVSRGFIVIIDYGYTREEQLAGRHRDTVTAFRKHAVSPSPYDAPGEQDITAHVNFTALAEAARQGGMQVQQLLTQSQFLMGIGERNQFADAFEECRLPQEKVKVALQLKQLVTPAGLGETFHVMIADKGVDHEKVARLNGLNFGRADR